jgi:hypothetical protein
MMRNWRNAPSPAADTQNILTLLIPNSAAQNFEKVLL